MITKSNSKYNTRSQSRFRPISKVRMTRRHLQRRPVNNRQCFPVQGASSYAVIEIDPYTNAQLQAHQPVLKNPPPSTLPPGLYTWVLMKEGWDSSNRADVALYLIKTLNMHEFGTKHQQLALRIADMYAAQSSSSSKKLELFYAGELHKDAVNGGITFNFISGTYMKKKITRREVPHAAQYMTEFIQNLDAATASTASASTASASTTAVTFSDTPLITEATMPLTEGDLQLYVAFGAIVHRFESAQACNEYARFYTTYKKHAHLVERDPWLQEKKSRLLSVAVIPTNPTQ